MTRTSRAFRALTCSMVGSKSFLVPGMLGRGMGISLLLDASSVDVVAAGGVDETRLTFSLDHKGQPKGVG
jgi:hypothetical protein